MIRGSRFARTVVGASVAITAVAVAQSPGMVAASARVGTRHAAERRQAVVAAPTPTPARPGKPTTIAAVGDSITQSTGTGALSAENPENSWATGWSVNSVAARLGIDLNKRFNLSENGDTMSDFAGQITNGKSGGSGDVAPLPPDAGLVLIEMGGNDLCRDSVANMTSVATYRAQFRAGLAAIATRAPNALIQVMSVPDIYNLWYIRGAPQDATYHPEPESSQATGINGARFYWDGLTGLGVKFPCQSLLHNPSSYSQADRDRRAAVRTRNKEYNQVLSEECGAVLRCKTDGLTLFDLTSNRSTPPDGPLLPQAQWQFTDLDISRNTAFACPIPGLVGGGCGDHFHPSKQGQGKIADTAWLAGRNWSDTSYPTASATVLPSPSPSGVYRRSATVRFGGTDAEGLRGQEVRWHQPDGTVTPWTPSIGIAPDLVVNKVGTSYVEVRSLDVNGNLSASKVVSVDVLPAAAPRAPGTPQVTASGTGLVVHWTAPTDDGGDPVTRYDLQVLTGTPPTLSGGLIPVVGAVQATAPAPPPGEIVRYRVSATNANGTGSNSGSSGATVAPFGSLAAFTDRQYRDLLGRPPTASELLVDVDQLDRGEQTPAALVERLRGSTWFDGAYGPAIRLYRAYFLRLPDPSGLDYWAGRRRAGVTLDKISQQFSVSSEFKRRYGDLTDTEFIDTVYQNVFDRPPDPSGRAFYLGRLNAGWSRGRVVLQFSESSEYQRKTLGLVTVIELHRGMDGKAPAQAVVDADLITYGSGGSSAVFAGIAGSNGYRTRVFA